MYTVILVTFFMLGYFVKGIKHSDVYQWFKNIFMLDLLQQTHIFSLQKTLIDRPESCLITCGLLCFCLDSHSDSTHPFN